MGAFVFIVIAIAIVVTVGYVSWQREQKRRDLLGQWALANSWTLAAEDDALCERWQGPPFGEGDHRRACNVLTGQWQGHPFTSFDYSYETHSSDGRGGRSTSTHRFAVTALALPTPLPRLQVTPENLLTRVGEAVGLSQDIELESEDFNRAFRVHADNPKFASDVLTPRTMELLLSRPRLCWRIEGSEILCWRGGEQEPAQISADVATTLDVVAGIPTFVWHDNGYDAGSAAVGGAS